MARLNQVGPKEDIRPLSLTRSYTRTASWLSSEIPRRLRRGSFILKCSVANVGHPLSPYSYEACLTKNTCCTKPLARQAQGRPKGQKLESGSTEPFHSCRRCLFSRRMTCARAGAGLSRSVQRGFATTVLVLLA